MKTKTLYCSVDLHAERSVLGVMNEHGQMVSTKRFATTREAFEKHVSALGYDGVKLTVEMGPMTRWLVRILRPLVGEVVVCNPRYNKLVSQNSTKNDFADVKALCELLRLNAIRPIWIGEDEGRELYRSLVWDMLGYRNRARYLKSQIKAKYRVFGVGQLGDQQIFGQRGRGIYLDQIAEANRRRILLRLYDQYDFAHAGRLQSLRAVREQSRQYPEVRVFQAVPGIAEIGSNVFCALVEDPHRFPNPSKLWKFCRLGITNRTSDGKPLGYERIDRAGHGELKNVSYTAWRTACSRNAYDNPVKAYYQASLERCGGVVRHARLNTQRKILSVLLSLWKSSDAYDPEKFFPAADPVGEAEKKTGSCRLVRQ